MAPAGAVAHEPAGFRLLAIAEDRRQRVAGGQHDQLDALSEEKGIGTDETCANALLLDRGEGIVEVTLGAGIWSRRDAAEDADDRHRRLLRARCERPRRRAGDERDDLAPPYVAHGAAFPPVASLVSWQQR